METISQPLIHQLLFEECGYSAEMCIEEESLRLAYHLRYRAYLHVNAISPNPEELCTDPYDQQQNTRTFLVWYEGRPVASVRNFTWSAAYHWEQTPSVKHFSAAIDKHLGLGAAILETNRYVVDPDFRGRQSLTAQMLLYRIQTLSALADHCDYVIAAVRPRHASFYERMMNFRPISKTISVPEVNFQIQLLATPVSSREKLAQQSGVAAFREVDLENYINCF